MTANHPRDILDGIENIRRRVIDLEGSRSAGAPMQRIKKVTVGGPAPWVLLDNIPQNFTNLRLVIAAKSDGVTSSGYDSANLQFNGVTTATYNWSTIWVVQGGAVSTTGGTAQTSMQFAEVWNSFFGSQGRGIITVDIPGYSDTNSTKSFMSSACATDGGTAGILQKYSGALNGSTAAITSIKALMGVGNFVAGTFSLYGM
jgi:hypothetical protein